jgi:gas vesicle protein
MDDLFKEDKTMSENKGSGGENLIYFLIGVGIGAITSLLFAPKAGNELRSEIADATRKGLDYARDTGHEIGERASTYYRTGFGRMTDLTDRGKDLINRKKVQFAAAIETGKQEYRKAKQSDQGKVSEPVKEKIAGAD